jgi:prefoldin subunit 5
VVFLIVFPFLLNWLLLRKPIAPVVGDGTTWLSFWPVYLSAIASFGMIYMTFLSLKQSREQIEDIKQREDEARRARLVFSVVVYQTAFYLRILNIGKENAFNIKLEFNNEFINEIEQKYQKFYTQLSRPDFIEAGKSIYILIGWCENVNKAWEGKNIVMSITGSYNDKYSVDETLDMEYFIGKSHFIVKGDLETTIEYMKKGLVVQNDGYKPVQKSLDEIAHTMMRIDYSFNVLTKQLEERAEKKAEDKSIVEEVKDQAEAIDPQGIMTD